MTYLHTLDSMIIHGDIKGANILVDEHACCRLADFGLATVIESHRLDSTTSSSGGPKGTLSWMAPEMFEVEDHRSGKDVDKSPRDIYAYGCTIFEIITGAPPFSGLREGAIIKQVMSGNRPPKPIYGWCPDLVWDLVERCWAQSPVERPRAAQIERYLERVGNGEVAGLDAIFGSDVTSDSGQGKGKKALRTCQECRASFTSRESFLGELFALVFWVG
ncbi:Homeobox protein tos8 [Paramarasmius palmivorus]|uniref:Homeobox protein tos8 n=1 Tax=Paramarasmius palmivorus TaxID=297713 RepID=A0AAW0CBC7_9AGAR